MSVAGVLARRGGPWLARRVGQAEDHELERLLRSRPVSALLLWSVFKAMPARVRPGSGIEAVVEWRVSRRDGRLLVRRLVLSGGGAWMERGAPGQPEADLVLTLDDAAFLRLAAGSRSVTWLVLRGHLRIEGSKLLAARLLLILEPPVPSPGDG